ncbi:YigZ family protein [Anaerococcus sp. NML200574]|uniref:YigZ family protein n=1 Tax=Anaerococcus sp. NML200574 TaxID=2954486 RepID=UPI002238AA14|nr:YigZ family protein [Anaerococcus sp. NML200574]MCW6678532.1 YigZ family protein [Anaerococcus sp. NML200574]
MPNSTNISSGDYKTIEGVKTSEFEVEKSVFITRAKHVESEEEALAFIEEVRGDHKDATHNCTAYIINTTPEIKRYNDDGEPQGSAGLPMLSVLEKEEATNVCVVVTRYFGGKLLGKGGLVRAYTKGVADTIGPNLIYKRDYFVVELILSYNLLGQIENYINEEKYQVIDKAYTDIVKFEIYVRHDKYEKFEKDLINLTSANIEINKIKELMLYEKGRI